MEYLKGPTHPALLLKKCPECNFLLKNQFTLAETEKRPFWRLFCPNMTCSLFGDPQIVYGFIHCETTTVVDDQLINDTEPDTAIESD